MGTSKQLNRGYGHLWKSNDTPTDDEDLLVRSEIQTLKVKFEQLAGRAWRLDIQDTPPEPVLSKKARKVDETIRQHIHLLSCTRRIPTEIWQKIFTLVILDIKSLHPANRYDRALRALCNVCRGWNVAARGHQGLWTKFPTFEFGDSRWVSTPLKHQGRTLRRLEQYIVHSGTRPFTFGYILHHERHLLDAYVSFAYAVLKRLVRESHRWEGAVLYLARGEDNERPWPDEPLAAVKGNVPVLRSLDLTVAAGSSTLWSNTSCIPSLFSDAPNLRHVVFNSPQDRVDDPRRFDIELPWSQLETFEGLCHTNDSFGKVTKYSHNTLKSLTSNVWSVVRSGTSLNPTTMARLTTLNIRFISRNDLSYLLFLSLPSLTDFELHGDEYDEGIPLFRILLHLIHQSHCSLTRLVLALCLPLLGAGTFQELQILLFHCPLLAELDIRVSYLFGSDPGTRLNPLVTPIAGREVAPHLRKLTLRSGLPDFDCVVDPLELMEMFTSRPGENTAEGTRRRCGLEEIRLVHCPYKGINGWPFQLNALDRSTLEAFGPTNIDPDVAYEWETGLLSLVRAPSGLVSVNPLNIKRHHDMMKRMEELDLDGGCDLRILARRGAVHLLSRISQRGPEEGAIPGDKLFHFRKRAAALCDKWKPHLLRNYRSTSYRWYRIDQCSAKLVYMGPAPRLESDAELWDNIIGYGSEHNKECGRTEPWRSVTLLDGFRDDITVLRDAIDLL